MQYLHPETEPRIFWPDLQVVTLLMVCLETEAPCLVQIDVALLLQVKYCELCGETSGSWAVTGFVLISGNQNVCFAV